jgi:hypothetical protein
MKKALLKLVAVIAAVGLTGIAGWSQCISTNCKNGGVCFQTIPPHCVNSNSCLSMHEVCLSTAGYCTNSPRGICNARICVDLRNCPPNPNGPVEVSSHNHIVTYVGIPGDSWNPPNPSQSNTDLWCDPAFLVSHPNFDRTETFSGQTAYVLKTVDDLETIESWYVPYYLVPLPLKITAVDFAGNTVLNVAAVQVQ